MRKWLFTASTDAIDIDYETIIYAKEEPNFWKLYNLAERHGCEWWSVEEINEEN